VRRHPRDEVEERLFGEGDACVESVEASEVFDLSEKLIP